MQNDEQIWQCINHGFCSFKVKTTQPPQTFCKNQYNVTGLCNRVSCPLANSQYGTIIEDEGVMYLYIKTVERAHTPKQMWEKIKLSKNYMEALDQISKAMEHWPDHQINRCKQRLTRMRQVILRMRKLAKATRVKMVPEKKKTERRERTREEKAERIAKVDLAIERELLERLRQGTYGDIYNFPKRQFDTVMEREGEKESEDEEEEEKNMEEEEEFEMDDEDDGAFVEDDEVSSEGMSDDDETLSMGSHDLGDLEDLGAKIGAQLKTQKGKRAKRPSVEVEYEMEDDAPLRQTQASSSSGR